MVMQLLYILEPKWKKLMWNVHKRKDSWLSLKLDSIWSQSIAVTPTTKVTYYAGITFYAVKVYSLTTKLQTIYEAIVYSPTTKPQTIYEAIVYSPTTKLQNLRLTNFFLNKPWYIVIICKRATTVYLVLQRRDWQWALLVEIWPLD